jgi:outer membrane protein, multidrug efflux system
VRFRALVVLLLCVPALAKGPKYQKPSVTTPQNWQTPASWQEALPLDSLPKGMWWAFFGDAELNQYEQRAMASNQTLQAAVARLSEARASARVTAAGLYPELEAGARAIRERVSGNRPVNGATVQPVPVTQNEFSIPFTLNYEIDLFGRVRHSVEAANAQLQASAADLENVRLLVSSELAADYFQLRELDSEIAVVQKAITYQQQALTLVNNRHTGGAASGLEVAQQQVVLDSSMTQ